MNLMLRGLLSALSLAGAVTAHAQTDIQFWHSMPGALGERVVDLSNRFNASQKEYKVVPLFKGSYEESMAAAIAAFRAGNAPHVLQVFEVGTATMMAAKGAIKPVYQIMREACEPFDPKAYVASVAGYYTDTKGNMLSFPFNSSTTVFFYNKEAFQKAGIPADSPPKTWGEVMVAAAKLKASGTACAFTTGWQSWVHLENLSAWHNVPFAVSALPYHGDTQGAPQNTIIGGASLWVMSGKSAPSYKGVAKFFNFLSEPTLQAEWHQQTGYLPITPGAYELTKKQGFYEKNPGTDVSVHQMTGRAPTANSKGLRLGSFVQIRGVIDEELESVWAGKKTGQQALDAAVQRGNELLRRFERANKSS